MVFYPALLDNVCDRCRIHVLGNVIITKFHSFSPFFVKKSVHKISICTREKKNGPELTFIFPAVQTKFVLLLHTCNQASLFLENFGGKRLFIETGD